jgi:hypothetical protein
MRWEREDIRYETTRKFALGYMETNEVALERGEQKKRPDEEDWWPFFIQSCC